MSDLKSKNLKILRKSFSGNANTQIFHFPPQIQSNTFMVIKLPQNNSAKAASVQGQNMADKETKQKLIRRLSKPKR